MKKPKVVSLKEAIEVVNEAFQNDPAKSGRNVINIGSLYQALHHGKLKRYGSKSFRQVEVEELLSVFGPDKAS